MSGVKQNMGVHTYAVGMTLTAAQYYEIKDGLGDFLELEVIAFEEASRETHLKNMEKLLTSLGLSIKDTVRTSYLGMLM